MLQTATIPAPTLEDLFNIIPINGGLYMRPRTLDEEEILDTNSSRRSLRARSIWPTATPTIGSVDSSGQARGR